MQHDEAVLPPTKILYMTYEGNWLMDCESTVLDVSITNAEDRACTNVSIVLDRTVLHAQGGGQPSDVGRILLLPNEKGSEVMLDISKVVIDRSTGVVCHNGKVVPVVEAGSSSEGNETISTASEIRMFKAGDSVKVTVDEDNRRILSECHTAGHVVDAAMARCGKHFKSGKAYHFLEGPYVEYSGSIPDSERDAVLSDLQTAFCQLVAEDLETEISLMSKDEADTVCNRQAENFDLDVFCDPFNDNLIRVVTVAGFPCPCGGTHVRTTCDLAGRQWGITAIKSKKGVVRVKYGQGVVQNGKSFKSAAS